MQTTKVTILSMVVISVCCLAALSSAKSTSGEDLDLAAIVHDPEVSNWAFIQNGVFSIV